MKNEREMLMNRRVGVIATALVVNFMFNLTVLAAPDTSNSSQATQVNSGIEAQIQNLESSIEILDNQIEQTLKNIDDNNNGITKTESDIKKLQEQITYAENDIKDHKSTLNKRARAFYINGIDGYVEIIMDSKNFDDLISRVESVKRIIDHDEDIITNLDKKKKAIVEQKEKLQQENKNLLALKADNEKKLATLNEHKENQKKLIEQLKITALNDELKGKLASLNISLESLPSKDNAVISYSYQFLGIPYLWGGTTPSGFDCSGFMQYVFAHFGVGLGRTTYDQIKEGKEITIDQLQPGDLVFFGTPSDPHHVGMYIGNGMYIHAPHTGDVIKVSLLSGRGDYLTARRVK